MPLNDALLEAANLDAAEVRSQNIDLRPQHFWAPRVNHLMNKLGQAVLTLNQKDWVHRDLKVENAVVDRDWNVLLIDVGFGCRHDFDYGPTE